MLAVSGCATCNKITTQYCARCKCNFYCSKECQKKDWFKHKIVCSSLEKDSGKVTERIVDQWTCENRYLFEQACLEYFKSEEDTSRFIVFLHGEHSYHFMTEDEVKKRMMRDQRSNFWETTFILHENKGEDDISVIIPYRQDGTGNFHFIIKSFLMKKNV